jgi:hypothetical protein
MIRVRNLRIVVASIVLGAGAGLALTQNLATDRHSVAPNYVAGIVSRMLDIDGTKLRAYVLRE